jgi:TolB-like protein/Tfp pilus assembly protein PilF
MDPGKTKDESGEVPAQESFIRELTRRRVVQVALLYFAIAWTATEVLSFLFESIPVFPIWSKTLVAILFMLGFPVAMFLAWRFDIGPGGIRRTESSSTRGKLTVAVSLVLLVASTAGLFYLIYPQVRDQASSAAGAPFDPPENSIAVMSFLNMGNNPENEYFSQGVPDTILHKLANLKDLIVVARTSSFALSDGSMDAATIGRELNVHYLLEGSVQRVGDDLRIITQLINTPDATHVWSLDQRLVLDDIFAVQDEIALEITNALKLTLQDEERERLLAHGTESVPAYLEYLSGNFAQQSRVAERLNDALGNFSRALEFDPAYARAYVGLARTYELYARYGLMDRQEALSLARRNIERALEYDDKLGEAYALLAVVNPGSRPGDIDQALIDKAMALSPNDPGVLQAYARSLCTTDDSPACFEKQADIMQQAIDRSPDNANFYFQKAWIMMSLGRLDEVPLNFAEAVRRNPDMSTAYNRLGRWLTGFGNEAVRGVSCLREAVSRDPTNPFPKGELASAYIDLGLDDLAEQVLGEVSDPRGNWDNFVPFMRLKLHAYRGEHDEALEVAKRYYKEFAAGSQLEISMDLLIDDASKDGDFTQLIEHLERQVGPSGEVDNIPEVAAAVYLIRIYEITGNSERANELKAMAPEVLSRRIATAPRFRPSFATMTAQMHLWQDEGDSALTELELIPGVYKRHAWYIARDPAFERLHGNPRFEAIVDAIQADFDSDREQILKLGDDLPPCVTNMRLSLK